MHTSFRAALGLGLIAVITTSSVAPAWGDDRRDDRRERWDDRRERWEDRRERWERRERWHEWQHRRELERHRAAALWRFERDRGWRWEHRPGVWSPFFVWWVVNGRPFLRPYPTVRIVRYPTGYYELLGDGITVPFYWVWRPTAVVVMPPAPPLPPDLPPGYGFPPDGAYPPPPPLPQS